MTAQLGSPSAESADAREPAGRPAPALLAVVWQRKWLVLLGLVAGLLCGCFYYLQQAPVYQSSAQVLIRKKHPDLPLAGADGRATFAEDYLATNTAMIKSHESLRRAAEELKKTGMSIEPDAVGGGLTVGRDKEASSILVLSYRSPVPAECPVILDAIIKGYRGLLGDKYSKSSSEAEKLLQTFHSDKEKNLEKQQEALKRLRTEHTESDGIAEKVASRRDALRAKESRRDGLLLRRQEIEVRRTSIQKLREGGADDATILSLLPSVVGWKPEAAPARTGSEAILKLRMEEKEKMQYLGADHPEIKNIRERIRMLEDAGAVGPSGAAKGPRLSGVNLTLAAMDQELDEIKRQFDGLETEVTQDRGQLQRLEKVFADNELIRKEIDRLDGERKVFVDKLHQIDLLRDAGGYEADPLTPPGAGVKVAPVLMQSVGPAAALGLLLGLALAYLAELTDKSFRSPDEIRRRLGLPVVGHVPPIGAAPAAAAGSALGPTLCAYHRPRSLEAESYRGVRTALYFSTHGRGHQVIQVTSPNVSDGKSTLAANLAISVAQSGKRVVLVDADFRRPRIHTLFGLGGPQAGLAGVIAGDAGLDAALHECPEVPNLWLLPCGPRPANPAELLTTPRFQELLAELRGRFEFVLLDTPPVLAVSDPSVVAPRADGVLLTIRVVKNGRPSAERAREVLQSLGANILGVVVNGFAGSEASRHYRYYSAYGYGNGYGGYGYAYAYNRDYITDGDAASTPRNGRR